MSRLRQALAAAVLAVALAAGPARAADPVPVIDATLFWPAGELADTPESTPTRTVLIGDPLPAPFPFDRALPSWNGKAPAGTGMRFAIRVRPIASASPSPQLVPVVTATPSSYALVPASPDIAVTGEGDWSPWLNVGEWGDAPPPIPPDETLAFGGASVDVDTLMLERPATAFQWRVILGRTETATESASLSRLALAVTGPGDTIAAGAWHESHPEPTSDWSGDWPVPFTSQQTDDPRMKSSLCSPTTTYMALAYAGARLPPLEEFSRAVYDRRFDMFGVWPRAVAAAAERGLPGYVARIRSWTHLRAVLAQGHLVGASIRFNPADLVRPPPYTTSGHLTLIRGILPSGEIVTNDPASSEAGERFVWLPEDFARAWFGKGGVAYIFEVPAK